MTKLDSSTDGDRALRLALRRDDHSTVIRELEPNLRNVVRGFQSPGVSHDDLMQAARIGAHAALLSFNGDRRRLSHVVGWVVLVSRRSVLDMVRAAQREGRLHQWDGLAYEDGCEVYVGGDDPADVVVARSELQRAVSDERARRAQDLARVEAVLTGHQSRAFALVHRDGLSYSEAAARLGVSVKTVRVYVWRGRRVLDTTLPQPAALRVVREAA